MATLEYPHMAYRGDALLACPHCDEVVLSLQTVVWIKRRACRGCQGVWFDNEDLAELSDHLRIQLAMPCGEEQPQHDPRECPRCAKDMKVELVSHKLESVPIDICHDCGVWFDHEELEPFLAILMAAEDAARSPFERVNRPWWAATLSFLINALGAGGNKKVGW